ncbi:hypothetical protein M407DRAFT_4997 [Tulasnella calospora MUT 4182]|uniref:Uncharacterized protein n=1 Tax=Tulasnella calospora MUT 4182 TaxID=1051891 RepID=A0A0C3QTH9_9AGAM|nr:hypothetical protein M407DRAFT_4997 [Tulasnella calospora MUT 4182]
MAMWISGPTQEDRGERGKRGGSKLARWTSFTQRWKTFIGAGVVRGWKKDRNHVDSNSSRVAEVAAAVGITVIRLEEDGGGSRWSALDAGGGRVELGGLGRPPAQGLIVTKDIGAEKGRQPGGGTVSTVVLRLCRLREGMFWIVQRGSGAYALTVIIAVTMERMAITMRFQVRPEEDENVSRKDWVKAHQP